MGIILVTVAVPQSAWWDTIRHRQKGLSTTPATETLARRGQVSGRKVTTVASCAQATRASRRRLVLQRAQFRTHWNAKQTCTLVLIRVRVRVRHNASQWHHPQGVSVIPTMGRTEPATRPASQDTTPTHARLVTPVTRTAIGRRAASHALRRSATGTRTDIQPGPRRGMAIPTSIAILL
jgi:hypothetical protein